MGMCVCVWGGKYMVIVSIVMIILLSLQTEYSPLKVF